MAAMAPTVAMDSVLSQPNVVELIILTVDEASKVSRDDGVTAFGAEEQRRRRLKRRACRL